MDIYQEYGNDLVVDDNGDLLSADDAELSNQRIIRRLLTTPRSVVNPPDYLDHPDYGAGTPFFIGQPNTPEVMEKIKGIMISQMYLEDSVSQNPQPEIEFNFSGEHLNCTIAYTNLLTNSQEVINFTI